MRMTLVVMLDSEDEPQQVVDEVASALEFDLRTTVDCAVVFTDDGLVCLTKPGTAVAEQRSCSFGEHPVRTEPSG